MTNRRKTDRTPHCPVYVDQDTCEIKDNRREKMKEKIIDDSVSIEEAISFIDSMRESAKKDAGAHYRYSFCGINLDPFRIASIYEMQSFAMMTILKKCLCAGSRGHKDYQQDLVDIINAAERELEIINEDLTNSEWQGND